MSLNHTSDGFHSLTDINMIKATYVMNIMDAMSKAPLVDFGWPSNSDFVSSSVNSSSVKVRNTTSVFNKRSSNGGLGSANVTGFSMNTSAASKNYLRVSNSSSFENYTSGSQSAGVVVTKWKIYNSKANITTPINSSSPAQVNKMKFVFGGWWIY